MQAYQLRKVSAVKIELALLMMALLWYVAFYVLLTSVTSGKNGLDVIPMGWLVLLAFGPALSALLGFGLDRRLRAEDRPMRFLEILLVIIVTPQFLGALYVWWGLLHYMGLY